MFKDLDEVVFLAFTKFAHWFQRLTGRTNYFLAKIGVLIILVSITATIASYVMPMVPEDDRPSLFFVFFSGILGMGEVWRMTELDKAEMDVLNPSRSNPAKRDVAVDPTNRVFWVFACFFTAFVSAVVPGLDTIWWLSRNLLPFGVLIFRYFVDIDPLPPGKSKVKEFFEAISAYLSPAKTAPSEAQK